MEPDEGGVICPKCAWEQPEGPICGRCGVIVARHRAMAAFVQRQASPSDRQPSVAPPARSGPGVLAWTGIGAAALVLILWMTHKVPLSPPPSAPVIAMAPSPTRPPVADAVPTVVAEAAPLPTAAPTAVEEVMPSGRCALLDHGFLDEPPRPRVSTTWYTRGDEYVQAVDEMEKTTAPMFIYVHTDWCPYCRAFEQGLLSTATVRDYLDESAVKVKINPEKGPAEERLVRDLGAQGYPTVMLLLPGHGEERLRLYERGDEKKRMRDPEEFVSAIRKRVREQADVLRQRARSQARPDDAIADYTLALRLRPGDADVYFDRGLVYMQKVQIDEALDDFGHASRLAPSDPKPLGAAQAVLDSQKRTEEGIACWTAFIEANPSSGTGFWGRAQALVTDGLPRLGAKDAERACQLGEGHACGGPPTAKAVAVIAPT
jgi:tetratricopeptide (TPR) repeat protein